VLLAALTASAAAGWHPFPWTVVLLPVALAPWVLLAGGVALAVAALAVHLRDLRDLLGHLLNLLFFASPIIYSLEGVDLPPPLKAALGLNPLASVVEVYRAAAFSGEVAAASQWLAAFAVGGIAWWVGCALFGRLRETLVEAV
jgi:ABC-type polysaccharide/polyol phosphate export permease